MFLWRGIHAVFIHPIPGIHIRPIQKFQDRLSLKGLSGADSIAIEG